MKLNQFGQVDFEGPPLPPDWPQTATTEPLTIDITGGTEQSWWEANKEWVLPVGFVILYVLANR